MFLSSLGVLQIIASWSGLKGLSFFRYPITGYLVGTAMILGAFIWFFGPNRHYAPNPTAQMGEQFVFSAGGVLIAILITLLVSSVLKFRVLEYDPVSCEEERGVEVFKTATLFHVIRNELGRKAGDK